MFGKNVVKGVVLVVSRHCSEVSLASDLDATMATTVLEYIILLDYRAWGVFKEDDYDEEENGGRPLSSSRGVLISLPLRKRRHDWCGDWDQEL